MGVTHLLYRSLQSVLRACAPVATRSDTKVGRAIAGRRNAHRDMVRWATSGRDAARPLAWFHAPSVGEGHLASAVIDELHSSLPGVQIVYTFFSPSAEESSRAIHADVAGFLPWDLPGPMTAVLDAVRPDVLVFTKTEVWPVLVAEARRRGVPVALVGASVPDGAGRLRGPARSFLRPTWESLAFAGAATDRDRDRLVELGVRPEATVTTGDPAFDAAVRRLEEGGSSRAWQERLRRGEVPTIVAGSTWPSDEDVLFPALATIREECANARIIIAPHEPGAARVSGLLRQLVSGGWTAGTLSQVASGEAEPGVRAVVVDGVGDLALLYRIADVSYVGGGFHSSGLHSVLEPAAAASPVLFGPRHERARAARGLLDAGGAKIARDSGEIAAVALEWLRDPAVGNDVGRRARDYIERHSGAAERSAGRIAHLMKAPCV